VETMYSPKHVRVWSKTQSVTSIPPFIDEIVTAKVAQFSVLMKTASQPFSIPVNPRSPIYDPKGATKNDLPQQVSSNLQNSRKVKSH
jgi:hypothetical protein